MGVKGLWQLLEPVGRPVTLESLEGKVLAVDASILLNQAVKGMRDKSGQPLPNAHLVVLFNRLCKLLFYRVKPVFVFDGGVPVLKKKTLAARKERKLKARYGSNKAAEKLIKNYLTGKALESVTGRKSENEIFRNVSPREPDIFELHSLPETKSENSEEETEVNLMEEFYAKNDFESKFQDLSMVNVDSEDFRCLPEEIQHELIKDKMEEKMFTGRHEMPEDGIGFSNFQLQNVLQRGKLHQQLDKLRKNMNSRNTGEISGLSSQDSLGSEYSVQSRRIISQDTSHYILVKTNKGDADDTESSTVDDSNQGGFFHDHQAMQPVKPPFAPSFVDIDLTCGHDSDSEVISPLMDVSEIDFTSTTHDTTTSNRVENDLPTQEGKTEHSHEHSGALSLDDRVIDTQQELGKLDDYSSGLSIGDKVHNTEEKVLETYDCKAGPSIEVIDAQGETGKTNDFSELLNAVNIGAKFQEQTSKLYGKMNKNSTDGDRSEGNSKTIPILEMDDNSVSRDNKTATKDGMIEEMNEITSSEVHMTAHDEEDDSSLSCNAHDEIYDSYASSGAALIQETETNEAEIHKRKAEIESLLKSRKRQTTPPLCEEVQPSERLNLEEGNEAQADTDISGEFVLQLELSSEDDKSDSERTKELSVLHTEKRENDVIILTDIEADASDVQSQDKDDAQLGTSDQDEKRIISAVVSEFAGSSKEELQVMQVNLEMEQNSLQDEQARQARAAASVSNEMLTESQELLQLFGVPYLVSPMEAEAQCAFLDFTDQTHGTITDDSDVFLFGGQRVYKHLFTNNKHPELYTFDAINGGFALNRSQLIKLALITGSDYTEGIQGLGTVSAMEVLHEFNHEGFEALLKFKKWHDETKHNKQTTHETKVKKKLRTVTLPTGFPSREVFESYINPVIDETRGSFEWGKPDLHSLRLFANERLGWTASKTDEVLLPVLKQLNQNEIQKRIESFFPIKFQESRKKSSKRVRRVVNRFLNPDELNKSGSDEEKASQKTDKKTKKSLAKPKSKGKSMGLLNKQVASSSSRSRGRKIMDKNKESIDDEDGMFDQDLLMVSDGEFERLIADESLNESIDNKNKKSDCTYPSEQLNRHGKKNQNARERTRSEKTSQVRNKRKFSSESWELDAVIPRKDDSTQLQNDIKVTLNPKGKIRNNDRTYNGKKPKTANDLVSSSKKSAFQDQKSFCEDSSTPSDTDSEDERKFRTISSSIIPKARTDKSMKGSRGNKGRRGRRGRGKRIKMFNNI